MDNKKLMRILLRDVTELQELLEGMKISETYDPFEVELLATRISGVRHMLEVLSGATAANKVKEVEKPGREASAENSAAVTKTVLSEEPPVKEPVTRQEIPQVEIPVSKPEPVEYASMPAVKVEETVPPQPEPVEYVSKPAVKVEETVLPRPEPVEFVSKPVVKEEEPVLIQPEPAPSSTPKPASPDDIDNDNMELEEETVTEGPQTLGEKFSHGRSVNDLLLEHGKTDYKFSNMPVTSLQAAIGINDRFLFTRELFEGKSDAFAETIRKIDSFETIHDAAVYLRENFKWKKNETSLKFIDLVKRKFL